MTRFLEATASKKRANVFVDALFSSKHHEEQKQQHNQQHQPHPTSTPKPHQRLFVAVDIAIVVRHHPSLWLLAMVPQVELHFFPQVAGGHSPRWRRSFPWEQGPKQQPATFSSASSSSSSSSFLFSSSSPPHWCHQLLILATVAQASQLLFSGNYLLPTIRSNLLRVGGAELRVGGASAPNRRRRWCTE